MKRLTVPRALAAAAALAGCTVGPNYKRPPLNPARAASTGAGRRRRGRARSPTCPGGTSSRTTPCRALIARGARQRLRRPARGLAGGGGAGPLGIARSAVFPAVPGAGGGGRTARQSARVDGDRVLQLNVDASWEFDLWGRIRRSNEAALRAVPGHGGGAARRPPLARRPTSPPRYFELRELDSELAIARRTTGAFQDTYDLFDRRLQGGAASALETTSAEALLGRRRPPTSRISSGDRGAGERAVVPARPQPGADPARRGAQRPVPAAGGAARASPRTCCGGGPTCARPSRT